MTVIEDAYGDVAGYLRTSKGNGTRQLLDVATAADDVQLANELLAHVSLTESSLRAVLPAQILGRSPNAGAFMTVRGMMLLNPPPFGMLSAVPLNFVALFQLRGTATRC